MTQELELEKLWSCIESLEKLLDFQARRIVQLEEKVKMDER